MLNVANLNQNITTNNTILTQPSREGADSPTLASNLAGVNQESTTVFTQQPARVQKGGDNAACMCCALSACGCVVVSGIGALVGAGAGAGIAAGLTNPQTYCGAIHAPVISNAGLPAAYLGFTLGGAALGAVCGPVYVAARVLCNDNCC